MNAIDPRRVQLRKRFGHLLLAAAALLLTFLILDLAGRKWPIFSPTVWGNFGDWASALLPAGAILVSVDMWLSDRADKDATEADLQTARTEDVAQRLSGLRIEPRPALVGHAFWVVNSSDQDVVLTSQPGISHSQHQFRLAKGDERPLSELGGGPLFSQVGKRTFEITQGGVVPLNLEDIDSKPSRG